jgi:predicted ester cyclase
MLEERNKSLVLRWFKELSESRFESLYEEVFSPDSRQDMPPSAEPVSFEEFKPLAAETNKAFPLIGHRVEDIIAEGDKVVAKVLVPAVHGGESAGVPATGRALE